MENINISGFMLDMSSLDIKSEKSEESLKDKSLFEYVIYSQQGFLRKGKAFNFSPKERKEVKEKIRWIGYRNRYYCAIIKPLENFNKYIEA
jgi:hypothetical protein